MTKKSPSKGFDPRNSSVNGQRQLRIKDFPDGKWHANPWIWGKNLVLFGKIFVEKCMKMKEIRLGGIPIRQWVC